MPNEGNSKLRKNFSFSHFLVYLSFTQTKKKQKKLIYSSISYVYNALKSAVTPSFVFPMPTSLINKLFDSGGANNAARRRVNGGDADASFFAAISSIRLQRYTSESFVCPLVFSKWSPGINDIFPSKSDLHLNALVATRWMTS